MEEVVVVESWSSGRPRERGQKKKPRVLRKNQDQKTIKTTLSDLKRVSSSCFATNYEHVSGLVAL